MSRVEEILGNISPTASAGMRAKEIVAALTPPPRDGSSSTALVKGEDKAKAGSLALGMVPGLAGAAVGALVWKNHRVLGLLAGHAVGANAGSLLRGGADRKKALCQLGVEGAGIVGALTYDQHPVVGWVAGIAAGALATAFVDGSPSNQLYKKWMKK